jgi:hypothetical protein
LGAKAGLELSTHERIRLGLPSGAQEFTAIRERWATVTNEALKAANIEARVDHRSLAEQGIDREPRPHIPFAAYKVERAGHHSDVAESIRADYAARVQARLERQATPEPNAPAPKSLEEVRREARENWLKLRATHSDPPATQQSKDATSTPTRAPDHDQTL